MSHLHEILNYDPARPQASRSNEQTEPRVDQLEVPSSAEDDASPGSDDEIDELDEESDGEMEYDEEEPIPPTPIGTSTEPPPDTPSSHSQESTNNHKNEPAPETIPSRKTEKRPEPVARRKLEKHDRKIDLGLHDHKAHADCPDTLACLPDTTGRPQHTLPVILRCAILGSPRKRLTIREIYATMETKYPYYKSAGQTWKQSVRHHLSLNRLFERQPRPVTDPGFGSYWTVNLSAPPGTKRPRKRGRPNKDGAEVSTSKKIPPKNQSQPVQLQPAPPLKYQFQPQTHPPPPLPPLTQPQVNAIPSRSPHSHQDMQTVALHSPPLSQYHSPSGTHQSSQAPITLQLPPPPPSPRSHPNQHPNQHPNHRQQHQGRSYHPSTSVPPPQMTHPPSLSPSISLQPPPTASGHHHNHYPHHSQPSPHQQQQSYHPHQRPNQDHHTQYAPPPQHPAQHSPIGPPQSRQSFSHSHVQPHLEHHDNHRQSVSHSPQRKVSSGPPRTSAREHTYKHSSRGSDSDDGIGPGIRNTVSSDDSDEDMDQQYQPLQSKVFVPTKPSPLYSLPPYSTLTPLRREELLEQMRQEIATLRRSSAEAVSTSIRLSEQLANANLEVSRSREAVRDLEDMLQDEAAKRREAEKLRMVEMERRRAPEDGLSTSTIRSPTRMRGT